MQDTGCMDTWLPRLSLSLVVATVGLFAAAFAWLALPSTDPPLWLWGIAAGAGFATAVVCHIDNAAHDSLPSD